ncbi:MAG: hypothetical protein P8048_13290 [Calditrichia bacterium]
MARIHEYQGKQLLAKEGIKIPEGEVASNPGEVKKIADKLGGEVVIKAQAWTTGRFSKGLIQFAATANEDR